MKFISKTAVVALSVFIVAGCGKKQGSDIETLTVARASAVQALTPATALSADDLAVVSAVYENLTRLEKSDLGWVARPSLAASWSVEDGGESWLFKLQPERVFSDESAIDAAAIVASVNRAKAGGGFAATLLADVGRVDASDEGIRFTLARIVPDLAERLAHPSLGITGENAKGQLIGSGSYKLVKSNTELVTLEANANASRRVAQFGRVLVKAVAPEQQMVEFNNGAISASATMPRAAIADINTQKGEAYWQPQSASLVQLTFNLRKSELQSARLRNALANAINYAALPAVVTGSATPLGNFIPPALDGFKDNERQPQRNLASAKSVIAALPKTPALTLLATRSLQPLATALVADFAEAGVDVTAKLVSIADYNTALGAGDYQLLLQENQASLPSSTSLLLSLFGDPAQRGVENFSGFSSPVVWRLLDSASTSNDPERRNQLIDTALREVRTQRPVVPLYSPHLLTVVASGMPQPRLNPFLPAALPLSLLVREVSETPAK